MLSEEKAGIFTECRLFHAFLYAKRILLFSKRVLVAIFRSNKIRIYEIKTEKSEKRQAAYIRGS